MRNVVAFIFALLMPLGAWAEASNSSSSFDKLEFGTRLGAGLMYVITDSEKDYYPSNGGPWGSLSFDVAYGLTENLYLHSGVGLDYRNIFVYVEREFGCDYDAFEEENESYHHSISGHSEGFEYYQALHLEIPLLLQWHILGVLFVEGGTSFDLRIWSKEKGRSGAENRDGEKIDINKNFGASVVAGIGHQFSSGLFIDFRALFRVNDLIDADKFKAYISESWTETDMDGNPVISWKNYTETYGSYYKMLKFQLGVGYWF
ncbi:MAG: PorT family protein [Fibrobacter sp.]|nr:PorT family protein [Fibrobacter sp.]